jgi:hypothetical protein
MRALVRALAFAMLLVAATAVVPWVHQALGGYRETCLFDHYEILKQSHGPRPDEAAWEGLYVGAVLLGGALSLAFISRRRSEPRPPSLVHTAGPRQ